MDLQCQTILMQVININSENYLPKTTWGLKWGWSVTRVAMNLNLSMTTFRNNWLLGNDYFHPRMELINVICY